MTKKVIVVGAGLAGIEATWQLVQAGISVDLYEMRPTKMTAAHTTEDFAELVCSNSFKSLSPNTPTGILKQEMTICDSQVLWASSQTSIPAGQALAVDRDKFSAILTAKIKSHPLVTFYNQEFIHLTDPQSPIILCTGPLTSDALSDALIAIMGENSLYFYDAIAPIVDAQTIDPETVFPASRYGRGSDDYLNCPFNQEEYFDFVAALKSAEKVAPRPFEKEILFSGCMPIEAMAAKGDKTLSFGPLKPVGLTDPKTGKRPYAVVQLRAENQAKTAYNLVGCQTKLKYHEQERVFRLIPGLGQASFLKLGSIHRNTYINSPKHLLPDLSLKTHSHITLAGQITGVEGYLESAAIGLIAGMSVARKINDMPVISPPQDTVMGSLLHYITHPRTHRFDPTNANWGIIENGKKSQAEHFFTQAMTLIKGFRRRYTGDNAGTD